MNPWTLIGWALVGAGLLAMLRWLVRVGGRVADLRQALKVELAVGQRWALPDGSGVLVITDLSASIITYRVEYGLLRGMTVTRERWKTLIWRGLRVKV